MARHARFMPCQRFPDHFRPRPASGNTIDGARFDQYLLERLLRCGSRGPISNERLSLLPDGRVRYKLKRRWKDGKKAVIYEPAGHASNIDSSVTGIQQRRYYRSAFNREFTPMGLF
jgi:hypothetical protein